MTISVRVLAVTCAIVSTSCVHRKGSVLRFNDSDDAGMRWSELVSQGMNKKPTLTDLALMIPLDRARYYQNGLYGKKGATVYWLTTADQIGAKRPLYWIIVRVLSEKFGCFMRARSRRGPMTHFFCRDGRRVSFETTRYPDWVSLAVQQFDARGRRLLVSKGRLIARQPNQ